MALGQFNASPTRTHLACVKGVLHYLAGTTHLSIQFPTPPSQRLPELPSMCGLSDADWASDEKDHKSVSGYCFYFLDSLVSWSSRKQRTVSTSSTESEYYTLTHQENVYFLDLNLSAFFYIFTYFTILFDNLQDFTVSTR